MDVGRHPLRFLARDAPRKLEGGADAPAPTILSRMTRVTIALANLRPGSSGEDALALARGAIADAGRIGAAVVCFPECYVPGYRTATSTLPPPNAAFLEDAWRAIAKSAADARVAVVLGTERIVDGAPRISVLVTDRDGSLLGFQDKVQLDPSEESTFVPGADRHVFRVDDLTFGVAFCHEGWRYPETVRWAARRGAHVVFHPHFHEPESGSYRPTRFADPLNTFHEKAMLCRAAENTVYFASVNCAIEGSPTTSAIVNPDGTVIGWQPYGQEGLLVAEIDTAAATGFLASRCR
jgi:predicted amidohydrolase